MTTRHVLTHPRTLAAWLALCAALTSASALAQGTAGAPVSDQEVIARFAQRERERSQEVWLRGYALPPAPAPFGLRSLEHQLWYRDWHLRQQIGTVPPHEPPYCQPPYYIARPPFRHCPELTRR